MKKKKKHGEEEAMDWYSWLSKSPSLDPSHVYEYGLAFTRNELKVDEDLRYFNHEFLQSMGISVAKHRLEILKLARNKEGGLSRFVHTTKKLLAKIMVPHHHQRKVNKEGGLMRPCKPRLLKSGPLDRNVQVQEKMAIKSISGPLDPKVQERLMLPSCSPLAWGSGKAAKERMMMVFPTISPTKSGPLDANWALMTMSPTTNHNNPHSLWSLMFQDMKPT